MAHLDVEKAMRKFRRNEIWKAKKAVFDNFTYNLQKLLIFYLKDRAGSMSVVTNPAASQISTEYEDSNSDEEGISGSAQTHLVFNLAELVNVMDDRFSFLTPSFSTIWI